MSPTEAAVLGIVQGLTEFLPISSTAHLRVVPALLGWADPGAAFSAVIQLGSVLAVLTYFMRDLLAIARGFFRSILVDKDYVSKDVRLVAGILIGTLPICLLGLLLKSTLETENGPLRSLTVIGSASLVMGVALLVAEKVGKRNRTMDDVGAQDGLLVGLGQALALVPGCSRSGSTLTVAMLLGLDRQDAARYSFLLGIPAILLSGILEVKQAVGSSAGSIPNLLIALLTATITSYAAIWWMLRYLKSHSTNIFICYRLLFGIAVIALATSGLIR